jgi:diaminopimelate epimerase
MKIPFHKYQGTGNDFVIVDQRKKQWLTRNDQARIEQLCDRRFGIGADGLMLLQQHNDLDFEMIYFNADGRESSMCGNGGRCLTAFAHAQGVFDKKCTFWAIDGAHEAMVTAKNWVALKMIDVQNVQSDSQDAFLMNTGSPHYVIFSEDISDLNIYELGREVRYSNRFRKEGVNVNFVEFLGQNEVEVATYERGVEAETLSCGTGVTAAAIATFLKKSLKNAAQPTAQHIHIKTKGGNLEVKFDVAQNGQLFQNIWLCGPATPVFEGKIEI